MSALLSVRLKLGLRSWQEHVLFWVGGVSGLYAGQIMMHSLLAPDETLPHVPEKSIVSKLQAAAANTEEAVGAPARPAESMLGKDESSTFGQDVRS